MNFPFPSRHLAAALLMIGSLGAEATAAPANFLYTGRGDLETQQAILARPDIEGAQVVYNWRGLEPEKGRYDFSAIEHDLALTQAAGKQLVIQVQDRFFSVEARNLPDYILKDAEYGGGLAAQVDTAGEGKKGYGWAAMQWNKPLRSRYQLLLAALAKKFDGKVFAVNLPETSIDIDLKGDKTGFSCDAYFEAEMENLGAARAAFQTSHVVQYVNFWPCEWENDHKYMSRLFEFAAANKIGLGGPDIVPNRKGQMKNAYPFFNKYKGKLSIIAMAVQEPTLTYKNPKTGKPFTKAEFTDYGETYLGADVIFWSAASPWLKK